MFWLRNRHGPAAMRVAAGLAARSPVHPFAHRPGAGHEDPESRQPKGIEAWLVEDHTLPLIAMQFGFNGGSSQDPAGKEGLAYFVSGMLDEGAGDIRQPGLPGEAGRPRHRDVLRRHARRDDRRPQDPDQEQGRSLPPAAPGADRAAHGRRTPSSASASRSSRSSRSSTKTPSSVAGNAWFAQVFAGHPYGTPTKGSLETVTRASRRDDLKGYRQAQFRPRQSACRRGRRHRRRRAAAALDDDFRRAAGEGRAAHGARSDLAAATAQEIIPMDDAAIGGEFRPARPEAQGRGFHRPPTCSTTSSAAAALPRG